MEYAAARTTMCRQCGGAFAPAAPKAEPKVRIVREETPAAAVVNEAGALLRKFEGLWTRQRDEVVECFDCKAKQQVTTAASSTTCPKCSAHLDLRDYKITTSFSRAIRTHGQVHVTARGDLSSSNVVCRSALIEGKVRGNLHCAGTVTINFTGKIPGRISADHMVVERKASVQFFRRVAVRSLEVRGEMSGEVSAETIVEIRRNAALDGDVTAKAINVEKGGMFSGQLVIGSSRLEQAELIPGEGAQPVAEAKQDHDGDLLGAIASPLPAA